MQASARTGPPTRHRRRPSRPEQLPPYSPYGYDPRTGQYATGQYGPPYPPGEPPQGPPAAQVATLAVDGRRGRGAPRRRPGDRAGDRQQLEAGDGRRAAADAGARRPRRPRRRRRRRTPSLRPLPPIVPVPTTTPPERVRDTWARPRRVVYNVDGNGRAINITYVDTGGVLQTEFNVMLPWSKEVELPQPGRGFGQCHASSTSAAGDLLDHGQRRSGARATPAHGLTICTARRAKRTAHPVRRAHRQHRRQPEREHHAAAHRCPRGRRRRVDEHGEQPRREERHRPAGRGVEPEGDAFLALGGHPQHQGPRRGLRRPDEQAQQQPAHPERQRSRTASSASARRRSSTASEPTMTGLEPTRSSTQPAEHRPDGGDHARADAEQQHVGLEMP